MLPTFETVGGAVFPNVEVPHLHAVIVLAEELNFTRAAHRLHISQPALSKQIAELEEAHRLHLFTRDNRRMVELTDASMRTERPRPRASTAVVGTRNGILVAPWCYSRLSHGLSSLNCEYSGRLFDKTFLTRTSPECFCLDAPIGLVHAPA